MNRRSAFLKPGFVVGLAVVVSAFAGLGIYRLMHPRSLAHSQDQADTPTSGVPLGGPFRLKDATGRVRTEADFQGKISLVYFGYTYCPDVCPMGLAMLSQVMDTLDPQGINLQPIFITVDPARDTAAQLRIYAQNFHPQFVMLTGAEPDIQKAMKAYRVYAKKITSQDHADAYGDYLVDHSSIVYVMGPEGDFWGHFNHATPLAEAVTLVRSFLAKKERVRTL